MGTASPGTTCPSGKVCYGTVPDGGGNFFCNFQTGKCDPFDPCNGNSGTWSCNGTGSGGQTGGSTGGTVAIDPSGISFVVVGDTRPDSPGSPYPTQTIQAIFNDFSALSPKPMAVVATGDFQEEGDTNSYAEIQDYESAVALFSSPTYPSMGNHECVSTSITTCCGVSGPNSYNNTTAFSNFMQMLTDLNVPGTNGEPYYYETLTAPNGDTAKFVVTAANAWDSTQASWFDGTLAVPSTFTFVARHEPDDAIGCSDSTPGDNTTSDCPYIADVQTSINAHPGSVTLKLEGHTHELRFDDANDAIVSGGGGVAIEQTCSSNSTNTTYCNHGYVWCQERTDKTLLCTVYDAASNSPVSAPPPRVAANGTPTGTLNYAN